MTPHVVTAAFWDHSALWTADDRNSGHTTDGGRVFGVTRTRYAECDDYACKKVVVIDPEDREQVARLADALIGDLRPLTVWQVSNMATALRSIIEPPAPPKPVEPTGDGAVVLDIHGHRWTRIAGADADPVDATDRTHTSPPWRRRGRGARWWEHVPAVRVLSEGVPA